MKFTFSIAKILFLFVLLGANVIGFHYYFKPVASDNLKYIPTDANFVFNLNLKSVSGKLFNELLFNASDFEKDLLSKDEKKLVFDNSSRGITPFGLITFFRFPYKESSIDGISFNLDDQSAFIRNLEKKKMENWSVDGISIFKDEAKTFIVFETVAVLLFSGFDKDEAENMAVTTLQNESAFDEM
jgi:hypothetical protein